MIRAMAGWIGAGLMRAAGRDPNDPRWWSDAGTGYWPSVAGQLVTIERAQTLSIVTDCLNVVSEPIAHLPFKLYRRLPPRQGADGRVLEGGKQEVVAPLSEVLNERANDEHTSYEFRGQMEWDRATDGNAYAEILPGRRGAVDQLIRIDPNRVLLRRSPETGALAYQINGSRGEPTRVLRRDQVWHLRGLPLESDGLRGKSPIKMHRELLGAALAVQDFSSRFFANDASPGTGFVSYPGKFDSPESRKNYARAWIEAHGGANRWRPFVAEGGAKWEATSFSPENSQMIETDKERSLQITRIWGVQPHKVGILSEATFSNIEQQAIEFVTDTMLPRFTAWEKAVQELIVLQRGVFGEFVVNGLLRGDIRARYEAYAIGRQWGWLSANDVLSLENMNPIGPEGDVYLQPLNYAPAGETTGESAQEIREALARRDAPHLIDMTRTN